MPVTCTKCHVSPRRAKQRWCVACHAAWMRANRPKHSELKDVARVKANARCYANQYQRRGKLAKEPCTACGSVTSQKHHEDYGAPLKVIWLCRPCHLVRHPTALSPAI